jgi:hypothetical protein
VRGAARYYSFKPFLICTSTPSHAREMDISACDTTQTRIYLPSVETPRNGHGLGSTGIYEDALVFHHQSTYLRYHVRSSQGESLAGIESGMSKRFLLLTSSTRSSTTKTVLLIESSFLKRACNSDKRKPQWQNARPHLPRRLRASRVLDRCGPT